MSETEKVKLNDVNIEQVKDLTDKIIKNPEIAKTKWEAQVIWKGGFRAEAKIKEFELITSDEPFGLGGTNTAPNPIEQVLAALGNCLVVGYAANATAAGINIKALSITLEGDIDLHTFLGLNESNAGYSGISVKVNIDTDASDIDVKAVHEKVIRTSPVGQTLTKPVPVNIKLSSTQKA